MKLPHDQAIAIMGNVVEESQGDYKAVQKNGGGRGLIQWDGHPAPTGRYGQWGKIWASVAKPANVYDSKTDTMKNYWAPWGGLKGEQVRQKFINSPLKTKTKIYAESYLRPGKPRIKDRQLSAMQLDSIYNPRIKNIIINKEGGIVKAADGTKTSWISNSLGKVGNILNSDLGKSLFNGISSSIFGGGNSEPFYNVQNNYSDTMTDTAMQYILQQQQQAQALSDLDSTLKSQYDLQNPHSIDGKIVKDHYKWIALAPQQAQQKDLQKQQKELIDAQNKQQKTNYITNALTNTLQTGLDLALNYKPTTKKGSSVS